jgi:hypothetical protein
MHELVNMMDCEGNIRSSEREIMKAPNNAFVQSWIIKLCSTNGCQRHNGGNWSGTRLDTIHFLFYEKINNISALSEIDSYIITDSFNA